MERRSPVRVADSDHSVQQPFVRFGVGDGGARAQQVGAADCRRGKRCGSRGRLRHCRRTGDTTAVGSGGDVGAVRGPGAGIRLSGRAGPPVGARLVVVGDHRTARRARFGSDAHPADDPGPGSGRDRPVRTPGTAAVEGHVRRAGALVGAPALRPARGRHRPARRLPLKPDRRWRQCAAGAGGPGGGVRTRGLDLPAPQATSSGSGSESAVAGRLPTPTQSGPTRATGCVD